MSLAQVSSPIVVLDSGLGGLTVVRAIRRLLPAEDILYFGDTARVPYGSKSAATVTGFVRQIITYLLPYEPKHVVIACNTATAVALPVLEAEFPGISMSGVVEPGARAAVEAAGDMPRPAIGVIGTEATIRSGAYERAIAQRRPDASVYCRATPLLVPIIEEGRRSDDPLVMLALRQYLEPLMEQRIAVLVLGCTHYPIYRDAICDITGRRVAVIDSADKCAEDVRRRLLAARALRRGDGPTGDLRCFVTDDTPRFGVLAARFLGMRIDQATWVSTDDLHALSAAPQGPGLRTAV